MRYLRLAFLWLSFCSPAFAQVGQIPSWPPLQVVTGGSTPFSITFIGSNSNLTAGTSFTFTSQAIGTADATRIVAVGIGDLPTTGITVLSVTIGGISATQAAGAAQSSGAGASSDIWYAAVPTGTTANVVINVSASQGRVGIAVYSVIGTGAAFSAGGGNFTTSGSTLSATLTTPAGGGAIAVVATHNTGANPFTGTNLTIDIAGGVVFGTSTLSSGNDVSHSGSTAYGISWTGVTDAAMSVATFTP